MDKDKKKESGGMEGESDAPGGEEEEGREGRKGGRERGRERGREERKEEGREVGLALHHLGSRYTIKRKERLFNYIFKCILSFIHLSCYI